MNMKLAVFSVLGGVVVTLLTGLLSNTVLLGAKHYGYPLAWLIRRVLAPEYFPWRVDVLNLIVDLVIWIIIVGIVVNVLARTRKTEK
ncbi:MAG: hypothetical protein ACUVTM_04775 [Candidatus Bathyarchaeia archaeon]